MLTPRNTLTNLSLSLSGPRQEPNLQEYKLSSQRRTSWHDDLCLGRDMYSFGKDRHSVKKLMKNKLSNFVHSPWNEYLSWLSVISRTFNHLLVIQDLKKLLVIGNSKLVCHYSIQFSCKLHQKFIREWSYLLDSVTEIVFIVLDCMNFISWTVNGIGVQTYNVRHKISGRVLRWKGHFHLNFYELYLLD